MRPGNVTAEDIPYFKQGETVTVEAAHNGFVIYTEAGNHVAGDVQQMLAHLIANLTNHDHYAEKMKREQEAAVIEAKEVDIGTEEVV